LSRCFEALPSVFLNEILLGALRLLFAIFAVKDLNRKGATIRDAVLNARGVS
jgi:uncharacterized YccA/Bax inhibitor family protein